MIVVVMGVSGCGKSTVGKALAEAIGADFFDADHFHPGSNVEKMRSGIPLTDADRIVWLANLNVFLAGRLSAESSTILACSALRECYRVALSANIEPAPEFVYLEGSYKLIRNRMEARKDHYMPATLLRSQFDALEPPSGATVIDIDQSPEQIVLQIRRSLGR